MVAAAEGSSASGSVDHHDESASFVADHRVALGQFTTKQEATLRPRSSPSSRTIEAWRLAIGS
jgi:hypothetical protein